jgi:hypothetical protein
MPIGPTTRWYPSRSGARSCPGSSAGRALRHCSSPARPPGLGSCASRSLQRAPPRRVCGGRARHGLPQATRGSNRDRATHPSILGDPCRPQPNPTDRDQPDQLAGHAPNRRTGDHPVIRARCRFRLTKRPGVSGASWVARSVEGTSKPAAGRRSCRRSLYGAASKAGLSSRSGGSRPVRPAAHPGGTAGRSSMSALGNRAHVNLRVGASTSGARDSGGGVVRAQRGDGGFRRCWGARQAGRPGRSAGRTSWACASNAVHCVAPAH